MPSSPSSISRSSTPSRSVRGRAGSVSPRRSTSPPRPCPDAGPGSLPRGAPGWRRLQAVTTWRWAHRRSCSPGRPGPSGSGHGSALRGTRDRDRRAGGRIPRLPRRLLRPDPRRPDPLPHGPRDDPSRRHGPGHPLHHSDAPRRLGLARWRAGSRSGRSARGGAERAPGADGARCGRRGAHRGARCGRPRQLVGARRGLRARTADRAEAHREPARRGSVLVALRGRDRGAAGAPRGDAAARRSPRSSSTRSDAGSAIARTAG